MRLCELLQIQNRILSKNQLEFRRVVLDYKRKDIEAQSTSIHTIEKLLYESDESIVNPEMT